MSNFDFSYDILPLGTYETVPVTSQLEPLPENYSNVVCLNIPTDVSLLMADWNNFPKNDEPNYFVNRAKHFKNSIKDTVKLFEHLGFSLDNYEVYPLRVKGTNTLKPTVGKYTQELLDNFGVSLFRQQYVKAKKDWITKPHIDHPDFSIHGFRVFIPIDTAYIEFDDGTYELMPGNCYFVNIAKTHRGFSKTSRVVIMCQMASDALINNGTKLNPT